MATSFLPLVAGQELAKRYFEVALRSGRLSHAYLFVGPEGGGKRQFARELSKALFCESGRACGQCAPCRTVDHGNHPSVEFHGPPEGKSSIDIETIRALCDRTHYKTRRIRVAVLERAELMTEPAANALLKTLEEPPGDSIIILTAQSAGSLLPTIVSRCHRILFTGSRTAAAPREPQTEAWLEEVALPGFHARWDVKEWLAAHEGKGGATTRLQVRGLLDELIVSRRALLDSAAGDQFGSILRCLESLLDLRHDLDRNVNPDIILERLLRDLCRASRELRLA